MMKSVLEVRKTSDKPKTSYPCLRKDADDSGLVVLFLCEQEGIVVVKDKDNVFYLGEFSTNWIMSSFVPLLSNEAVILTN